MRRADADFYKVSQGDLVIAGTIVLVSLLSIAWLVVNRMGHSQEGKTAIVYHGHKMIESINLDRDGSIPILGGKMTVGFKKGKARVLNSDCPNHICVNTGWALHAGQTIVCVPNQVVIDIESRRDQVLDAVAF